MRNNRFVRLQALVLLLGVFLLRSSVGAELFIDIVSSPRKIPIAIQDLAGPKGGEISGIVEYDLEFSGIFQPLDKNAFIERPDQSFRRNNWTGIGAEAVVKGFVTENGESINATVYLYDAFEGRAMLTKNYKTKKSLLRPLAHSIANDIYEKITAQDAVFRTKIVFVRKEGDRRELHMMDWDGKRASSLNVRGSILLAPRWSKEGKKLIYSAERNRKWGIYALDFGKKKEETIFSGKGTNIAGDFFPGGREFALSSSRAGTPDIYIFNIRKSRLTRLTKERGIEVSPTVSPDGKSVAFVSDRGGTPQIYSTDKIGYNRSRITYEGNYNTSPTWSPKGDMLAFCGNYEGKNQIFTVSPDGSGLRRLTDRGNNEQPVFSPDGRFLAFTSDRDGRKGVYVMRTNGEAQRRISPRNMEASDPGWSPN
jgi:TolB protein